MSEGGRMASAEREDEVRTATDGQLPTSGTRSRWGRFGRQQQLAGLRRDSRCRSRFAIRFAFPRFPFSIAIRHSDAIASGHAHVGV